MKHAGTKFNKKEVFWGNSYQCFNWFDYSGIRRIKYIGMNKEKAGIEAIEEENRKVEEEAENKKEVENLLIITQYSMLIGRRLKSVV